MGCVFRTPTAPCLQQLCDLWEPEKPAIADKRTKDDNNPYAMWTAQTDASFMRSRASLPPAGAPQFLGPSSTASSLQMSSGSQMPSRVVLQPASSYRG
mmetsp:Transcript_50078/g.112520  ORF Transcript_50078/g.112520 Transcript_50078/m.112520 type:complete len:98 (-) Transcript_50078:70-363(-)